MRTMLGHVFVIRSATGEVFADADIVPTESLFEVEDHWQVALEPVIRIG